MYKKIKLRICRGSLEIIQFCNVANLRFKATIIFVAGGWVLVLNGIGFRVEGKRRKAQGVRQKELFQPDLTIRAS